MSLDHNSQLYTRTWLNQLVPFIAGVTSMSLTIRANERFVKPEERIEFAREMLLLRSEDQIVLSKENVDQGMN